MPVLDPDLQSFFRRGATIYPQPIAIAVGRLTRARTSADVVDASVKAAEVLTRYLAALCVASFAAREGASGDGLRLPPLEGNLSFGDFLRVCQAAANVSAEHPCRPHLGGFRAKGKGPHRINGPADAALVALLELRNDLGHDLAGMGAGRASAVNRKSRPPDRLAEALRHVEGLLSCPLLVVDQQRLERRRVSAVCLWLMGESADPEPEEIEVEVPGFEEPQVPYLACGDSVLRLDPLLAWAVVPARERYGLLVANRVEPAGLRYQTLDPVEVEQGRAAVAALAALLSGAGQPAEHVTLAGGKPLAGLWLERRSRIVEAVAQIHGGLSWDEFDRPTLDWYARRLTSDANTPTAGLIRERLLDGRNAFGADEIRQLRLLFGTQETVRRTLRRAVVDLRAQGDGEQRWKERVESDQNILCSLRTSVDFVARTLKIDDASIDQLQATTGSADYLAMREALVNLFIHQDYRDARAAGQVELRPERATFFNPGYSLIAGERLVEGGKSQSRNPLIARALRLIGFAELAGSGITALLRAWRKAQRRPPRFESDRENNSFSIQLDWRPVANLYDEFWKARIGVQLSPEQALALNLAFDPSGVTPVAVASGTGLTVDEAEQGLRFLLRQVLVAERGGVYFVADHLRDIVR